MDVEDYRLLSEGKMNRDSEIRGIIAREFTFGAMEPQFILFLG